MNRLNHLFSKKSNILNIYFTAAFPKLNDSITIMQYLQRSGVDLIEIGLPYSDPLADGPTIQNSNLVALENGFNLNFIFEELKNFRKKIDIPVILMGYFNPIFQYGVENFCQKCSEIQVDGIIIPDLPIIEYEKNYKEIFEKYQLSFHFLITPKTPKEKILKIDKMSSSFIYAVSTNSLTGREDDFSESQILYFQKLQNLNLRNPILVGFGIHNHKTFQTVCKYLNGAIVGSAFIKYLKENKLSYENIKKFVDLIKIN